MMIKRYFLSWQVPFLLTILCVISLNVLAEGTKQASPTNSADGASLLIAPDIGYGSYLACSNDSRIRFTILNNATENLYFGFQTRTYDNAASVVKNNAYYRIYNAAGTQVAGPALIPTTGTGYIATYAQAFAGPNIGGATPSGYSPFLFDPTTNGDFYIEIYASNDGGATMDNSANGRVTMPFFDFTVSTAANVQSSGRVWSRKWSFVTTNLVSGNFEQALTSSFTGDYFAYTPDQFVLQVQFQPGFRPLAYQIATNFTGVGSSGTFTTDRRSSNTIPTLANGYRVFLTNPDVAAFPNGTPGNPAITSNIYGCPGAYFIPYYLDQTGDVAIFLDLNGTPGFQSGTSDRVLEAYGVSAGNQVMAWNGLDGLGAVVPSNLTISVTVVLFQGRTNIPMIDAELNTNGFSVSSIFPALGNRKLYWDDASLTNIGTCSGNASDNITGAGAVVSSLMSGVSGPTHGWDGSGPGTTVPAPSSGGGSSTIGTLCDDFGNNRCINTWFYAADYSTPATNMVVPNCDLDNDGVANNADLDDDNDGIPDLVECSSDPLLDHDSDGIPNYLDPQFPGFVDANLDGVNDAFDFDRDGIINSFDLDADGDGITDLIEVGQPDANSNGQMDGFADLNGNGLSDAVDPACNTTPVTGEATANAGTSGANSNPGNITDGNAATFGTLTGNPATIDLDFGVVLPAGTTITLSMSSAVAGAATGTFTRSTDDVTYAQSQAYSVSSTTLQNVTYVLGAAARYVRVTTSSGNDTRIAVATYSYQNCGGVTGTAIVPVNTDGTGGANYLDIDSDNDGIVDIVEAQTTSGYIAPTGSDTDKDGIDNAYDAVSGFGGAGLTPVNTDGTDNPDYTDTNSDNDAYTDAQEGWDTDGNGTANTLPSGTDSDGDGLDNAYDTNNAAINPTNGTTPASYPNVNVPGTPEKDWRETYVPPVVTITGTASIAENAPGTVTLTLNLSTVATAATTVNLTYTGSATSGTDYVAGPASVTIPAGATSATLIIDPNDDVIYEGNEIVIVTISSVSGGAGATVGTPSSATVTITDNETVPAVTLTGTASVLENSGTAVTLTAALSVATTTATTVTLTYIGTATSGTDYTASSVTITIPAGSLSGTVTITPVDDAIFEGPETVIADITSVTGGNGAVENGTQTATVTITDNEAAPAVNLTGTTSVAENSGSTVTLTATLSGPASAATTVTLTYTGTATSGTDYTTSSITITIPAGSLSGTVTITPVDDVIFEGPETIIADITSVTGGNGAVENGTQTATVTITDNEAAPAVSLTGTTTVAENSGTAVTLTATLSVATTTATTVTLTYSGTATGSGTDYTASSATITIPAGATTGTVTITPVNDAVYEGTETVIATMTGVSGGNGAAVGTPNTATVTITDDETIPVVSISGGTSIIENAPGTVTLTVTLSSATTIATTVNLGYTGTATSGVDYVAGPASVAIPAGSTTATVVIDPNDDAIFEGTETVITAITSVSGGNGATIGTPASTTVNITDDEIGTTVSISGGTTIAENAPGVVTLTATLSSATSQATTITITYTGTASGTDYTASSATITIPAFATTGTVTIDPADDVISEGSETVIATITAVSGGNGALIGTPNSTTVTITDDEPVPGVSLSGTTSIAENAPGVATLTATLSGVSSQATTVTISYTGTASGTDYAASSTTITIPAGATTGTVTIDPTDDNIAEGSETVIATITAVSGGNGATIGTPNSTTVTITDDEAAPTVTLSGTATVAENSGSAVTLTAILSGPAATATTITLTYTGTATGSGTDYNASSTTITIPAGATTGTVTITPVNDVIYEGTETVIVTITAVSGGNGATIGTPNTATVTITDDETIPSVSISGGVAIIENSGGSVVLTATLSSPTTAATTVTLTYTGTASGTDYNASSATITILAGATLGTVSIIPVDDNIAESSETVIATITAVSGGNGATIGTPNNTTVTITDDEAAPAVTLSGTTTVAENAGSTVTLTATLSGPAATATTVTLSYTGTATGSGADYNTSSATITIPAGSTTGTVTITPVDDNIYEGDETVIGTITAVSGGNGATIGSPNNAIVTITENETVPSVSLSGTTTVVENSGTTVTLTATLSGPASTATVITIGYTGTAIGLGTDYTASSITITIPAGATTGTVTIVPVDDNIYEGNETVIATITNVSGGNGVTAGATNSATVTIIENDPVPAVSISGGGLIAENAGTGQTITVSLSGPSSAATTVTLTVGGTATNGTDYSSVATTVIIPAGATSVTFDVTPIDDAVYEGNETVVFTISSVSGGNGTTIGTPASATVTIIENDNATPVANNNVTTVAEDNTATIPAVQGNDTDADGNVVTSTIDLDPSTPGQQTTYTSPEGTWTVNTITGDVTFVPNPNFNGTASIPYTIQDNTGATSNQGLLTVTVTPVNDAPVAVNDATTIPEEGTAVLPNILGNDTDVDNTLSNANIDLDPTTPGVQTTITTPQGTWTVNPSTGDVTFVPVANYSGTVTIPYQICDDGIPVQCATANLTVTVTPVNDDPVVDNEYISVGQNAPFNGDLTDTGDSDPETTLTVNTTPVTAPANGTIVINTNGTYTYTPNTGYTGTDMVVASVCDNGLPLPAICVNDTIFITVLPTIPPVANNDSGITTPEDTPVTFPVTGNDTDPDGTINASTVDLDPGTAGIQNTYANTFGTWSVDVSGNVTFTPAANFNGTATVTYTVNDNIGATSNTGTITVTVTPVNDAPVVDNDYATIPEDSSVSGDFTNAGDSDPDGSILTVNPTPVVPPANGTIVINADGTYTYIPNPDFNGTDLVVVSVCDNGIPLPSVCVNDTLFLTITPVQDPPASGNENVITETGITLPNINVTGNNTDPDGDPLTVTAGGTSAQGGTVVVNPDGTITYTPPIGYVGSDTVVYTVCDTAVVPNCVQDTIFVNVQPLLDTDGDGIPNIVDLDDDNDGILDTDETATTSNGGDTDGDGIPDSLDLDSDNDGIPDVIEAGGSDPDHDGIIGTGTVTDTDGDGVSDVVDADNGGTSLPLPDTDGDGHPDFQDRDADNDGIPDVMEAGNPDVNGDGELDSFNDSNNDGLDDNDSVFDPVDTDGDGVEDYVDLDSDNDGIPDVVEGGNPDANGDGTLDNFNDANGDGLDDDDSVSTPVDTDGDGVEDYVDLDSDNDGIPDVVEGGNPDANGDGTLDNFNDANGDGLDDDDSVSTPVDTDGDGVENYVDLDSDNDGIPDVVEGGNPDANGDGTLDNFNDANGDGLDDDDSVSTPVDTDGDGVEDYVDLDSDNDGIPDVVEGGNPDANGDGTLDNFNDANGDGLDDDDSVSTPVDTDVDGVEDYVDLDSDNDGIPDVVEGGNPDANGDGMLDNFNDANGDGLDDDDSVTTPVDTDGDGNPDYTDTDSDNDSVPDSDENDPNGDGTGPDDSDGDGIPDYQDGDDDNDGIPTEDESSSNGSGYTDCDNDEIPDYLDSDNCYAITGTLVVPDAFSPNGDGTNETFAIEGIENFPGNTLVIFNRWGYEVFSAEDYQNNWNGTSTGKMNVGDDQLPTGTYYYILDTKSEQYGVIKGYVYLKR